MATPMTGGLPGITIEFARLRWHAFRGAASVSMSDRASIGPESHIAPASLAAPPERVNHVYDSELPKSHR
jgi:hypothetical protein